MAPGPGPLPLMSATWLTNTTDAGATSSTAASSRPTTVGKTPAVGSKKAAESSQSTEEGLAAAQHVRDFLEKREESSLKAWLRHFDTNNDQKISLSEFIRGMRKMNYPGDVTMAFQALDSDRSGELSLDEIDSAQSVMWRRFRAWCVQTFDSPQDMMKIFLPEKSSTLRKAPSTIKRARSEIQEDPEESNAIDVAKFTQGVRKVGWDGGCEEVIFQALDTDDQGELTEQSLKWLEIEKRRQQRKEHAKKRAEQENLKARASHSRQAAEAIMAEFKYFLKRRYGHYIRAWRNALSPDGSMVLQKDDLFKACAAIGWQGDVRLLYRAFDKDDSGFIQIEELDARSAEILAHFRVFVEQRFGGAGEAFRAFDRFNTKKLRQPEFIAALKAYGFKHPAKLLFHGLDVRGNKYLVEEDLLFLDKWRPSAFLVVGPNPQAAEEVKGLLVKHYKNYLKAWRHALDSDASNHCNYDEFEASCKKINYKGDIPGAWRALDTDMSGFITLHEIDPLSGEALKVFRGWCDDEFGNVRSAFGVFDSSGDNEVSYREFRRACRVYGFEGNVHALFHALDTERNGSLSLDEVAFLDEWDFPDADNPEGMPADELIRPLVTQSRGIRKPGDLERTTDYETIGPGPARYALPTTIGSGPMTPMVQFRGAYSFRKRPPATLPGINRDAGNIPSPGAYDDRLGWSSTSPRKACWAFGSESRKLTEAMPTRAPGPGEYSPVSPKGVSVNCTPRRRLRMHPMMKEASPRGPALSARAAHGGSTALPPPRSIVTR